MILDSLKSHDIHNKGNNKITELRMHDVVIFPATSLAISWSVINNCMDFRFELYHVFYFEESSSFTCWVSTGNKR
jgi:hypothetical protein